MGYHIKCEAWGIIYIYEAKFRRFYGALLLRLLLERAPRLLLLPGRVLAPGADAGAAASLRARPKAGAATLPLFTEASQASNRTG